MVAPVDRFNVFTTITIHLIHNLHFQPSNMLVYHSLLRATAAALVLPFTSSAMPVRLRKAQMETTVTVQNWGQNWTLNIDHNTASRPRRLPRRKLPVFEISTTELAALEVENAAAPASVGQLVPRIGSANITSTAITTTTNSTNDNQVLHDRSVGPVRNSDTSHPYDRIGRVELSGGVYCSGSLVGPDLVLTARHCVPDNLDPVYFIPFGDNASEKGVWVSSLVLRSHLPIQK